MSDLYQARMRWSACSTGSKYQTHITADVKFYEVYLHLAGMHAVVRLQQQDATAYRETDRAGSGMEWLKSQGSGACDCATSQQMSA